MCAIILPQYDRCQTYAKAFFGVTRDRLKLLGLYYRRCEETLRGRLAERVRQQVEDEAVADLKIHRQMRPTAAVNVDGQQQGGAGRGHHHYHQQQQQSSSDAVSELMETVAKLRLKSALEELEARSAHPAVRRRLLKGILAKVEILFVSLLSFVVCCCLLLFC